MADGGCGGCSLRLPRTEGSVLTKQIAISAVLLACLYYPSSGQASVADVTPVHTAWSTHLNSPQPTHYTHLWSGGEVFHSLASGLIKPGWISIILQEEIETCLISRNVGSVYELARTAPLRRLFLSLSGWKTAKEPWPSGTFLALSSDLSPKEIHVPFFQDKIWDFRPCRWTGKRHLFLLSLYHLRWDARRSCVNPTSQVTLFYSPSPKGSAFVSFYRSELNLKPFIRF